LLSEDEAEQVKKVEGLVDAINQSSLASQFSPNINKCKIYRFGYTKNDDEDLIIL